MALTAQNWTLTSYTNSTWTDLVSASAATVLKTVVVAAGANAAEVKVRLADSGGSSLAVLIPSHSLTANTAYVMGTDTGQVPALTLESGQKLQVWSDVAAVEFSAFGAQAA